MLDKNTEHCCVAVSRFLSVLTIQIPLDSRIEILNRMWKDCDFCWFPASWKMLQLSGGECWTSTEYLQIYHDYSRRCERHSKLPIWTQSGRKCSQWRWHFVYIAGWDCNLTFRRRPTNFTPRLTSLKKQPKMPTPLVTSMMLTSGTLERKLESLKQILKKSLRRWCSQVPKWMRQKKSLRTKMMMWMLSLVASFF